MALQLPRSRRAGLRPATVRWRASTEALRLLPTSGLGSQAPGESAPQIGCYLPGSGGSSSGPSGGPGMDHGTRMKKKLWINRKMART